ncbi:MAG TPA: MFS transporter [Terracidiphilus sp.]|nr:MFS transporter [Terracidiphilus sp.]
MPNSLTPGERELIATYVSYLNGCHFCQSIHGAVAAAHLDGDEELVRRVKADFQHADVSNKLKALLVIASKVQQGGKIVVAADVEHARSLGTTDVEIHDTVLIAAAFCMYNRYVDGLATIQPCDEAMYRERGKMVTRDGYVSVSKTYLPAEPVNGRRIEWHILHSLKDCPGSALLSRIAPRRQSPCANITVALVSPLIGILLDRFPPRRIILPGILVFAVVLATLSRLTPHIVQFYATFFVIGLVANATARFAYTRTILTWFTTHRGMVLALLLTGSGSILISPLTEWMIQHHGWRNGFLLLSGIAILGFPLTVLLVRNRHEAAVVRAEHHGDMGITVPSALRTAAFWILAFIIIL